jgi:putative transcriptional regulator
MIKVATAPFMDEATRAALASGRAEPALGVFLDVLMEMRGITEIEGEAIAGAALEAEAPASMKPDALAMAFAAIDRGAQRKLTPKAMTYPELDAVPAALRDAIIAAEGKRSWRYGGPGIKRLDLGVPGGAKIEVIRLSAGTAIPWHTHKGQELTLCLHGEFSDGQATYGPGDFSVFDGATRHQPRTDKDTVAFALAVTDAGLRFEGVLGALQKMFRQ